ncbi:class E sortase [Streptomyces tauricus]|uniref:Class E sortase n=2 Tax=Streptomyces tauricus TaxID=68274 RepID=A0ABZ1JI64_9ACTN|nr:class E sortase [Streptomyces tauricus]
MTALRPERDSAAPYGEDAGYGGAAAFEAPGAGGAMRAAVDGLADPLSDPLPGRRQPAAPEQGWYDPQPYAPDWSIGQNASTYAPPQAQAQPHPQQPYVQPQPQQPYAGGGPQSAAYTGPQQSYGQAQTAYPGYQEVRPPYGETYAPAAPVTHVPVAPTPVAPVSQPLPAEQPYAPASTYDASPPADETVALRVADIESIASRQAPSTPSASPVAAPGPSGAPGGRAARRKASRRHGRHGGTDAGGLHEEQSGADAAEAPVSRAAARRAAKARKPGAAVMASRAIGEVFITTGVLMLLFVTYQLYWTNIRAHAQADSEASSLQDDWASGKGAPGSFEPGQGFALLHIPKLDVVVPIAEGIDKKRVLDRGMVGHYAEEGVKTAMPDAKKGNFGLAGHRNTHGEPFRYINRLKPGDAIVVETQNKYFVYKMASILPVTSPSNTAVLDPIPKGSTFKSAGRYITLTTCTPEFTSKYRMIVWGTMVEERPRDKGKPDELVG